MKQILEDLVKNLSENVPGYIATSVTELGSGESMISHSAVDSFDPQLASAYNLEVVNAKLRAVEALKLEDEIKEISITLNSQIHIINIAPTGGYFIYLAIDSTKANLGITKSFLNKYKQELNNAL